MYERLIKRLKELEKCHKSQFGGSTQESVILADAANAIKRLNEELVLCRNELCLRCGNYAEAHKGACDGCRWRGVE